MKCNQMRSTIAVGFSEYGVADIRLRPVQCMASYNENHDTMIEYAVYL